MSKEQVRGTKRSGRPNAVTAKSKKGIIAKPESDEAEAMRLQLLAEVGEVGEAPGQLDALLDRAYLADSFFEEHALQDPACLRSPELFHEAWAVARALADFYQRVGQELGKEPLTGAAMGDAAGADPVKRLSCSEMMRLLERHGWSVVRRGKHPIYGKPGVSWTIPVPDHGNKTLAPGTQKSIMRAAELTEADL